jgi:hypothetical protein
MKKVLAGLFAWLSWNAVAVAGIRPSFSLEYSAWDATDIVVATEGEKIDGHLTVLEVWKGPLRPDDKLSIPELSKLAPESERSIADELFAPKKAGMPRDHVTGARMVLFLKRSSDAPGKWAPTGWFNDMLISIAWIEKSHVFAFQQIMNPGDTLLLPLNLSDQEFQAQVADIVQTQSDLAKAATIDDLDKRAEAIKPFITSKHYLAPEAALHEIEKCGTAAMPILNALIADDELLRQHGKYVEAMGKACGAAAGPSLTKLVVAETKFWKERAPTLEPKWQRSDAKGVTPLTEVWYLNDRLNRLCFALRALKESKYEKCGNFVVELRSYFQSVVHENGEFDGMKWIIGECDGTLKALGRDVSQ